MQKEEVVAFIRGRLIEQAETCRTEMELAQQSANSEEKSSAGDKYETGRAMSRHQRDFYAGRLSESLSHIALFDAAIGRPATGKIQAGSLFKAGEQQFFVGSGLGLLTLPSGLKVVCTTADSPLGKSLLGKKEGEDIFFAGKKLSIEGLS